MKQTANLQINQDLAFQRCSWRAQRIGWIGMTLFILAGSAGLLGPGAIGYTTIATPNQSLQLAYDRLIRLHAPARLEIQAVPTLDRTVQIAISRDYLKQFQIAHILPEPEQVITAPDRYLYHFPTSQVNQPILIVMDLEAEQMGWVKGEISLSSGSTLQFQQWIYP